MPSSPLKKKERKERKGVGHKRDSGKIGVQHLEKLLTLGFLMFPVGSAFRSLFALELCSSSSSSSSSLPLAGAVGFLCSFFLWLSAIFELGLQVGKADDLQEKRCRWDGFIVRIKPAVAEIKMDVQFILPQFKLSVRIRTCISLQISSVAVLHIDPSALCPSPPPGFLSPLICFYDGEES